METASLGPLEVSRICLGAMHMGVRTPAEEAHRLLDRYFDAGGNFVDTADVYGDGASEETLAPWLARRRDEVVVATKVRWPVSDLEGAGLSPERVERACEASLRRLGVDTIDLYQVHAPDPDVPLEETLEALDRLVEAGKVRALGVSNYPAWLLAWAVATQDREGFAPFVAAQYQYSLVERSIELEILPFCRAAGLGVIPWGPLGAGFLTGRYSRDSEPPPGSRLAEAGQTVEEARSRRAIERNFKVVDEAFAVAQEVDATVPQVALAWLLGTPGVTAPIVGPRTLGQLEDLLGAAGVRLSDEQRARLESHAPPPEVYPQRFLREQNRIRETERVARPQR
jgi:aryl-alcohol dehydrogenase-like predicted oxidoreductase